jgi:hypothetical protein
VKLANIIKTPSKKKKNKKTKNKIKKKKKKRQEKNKKQKNNRHLVHQEKCEDDKDACLLFYSSAYY